MPADITPTTTTDIQFLWRKVQTNLYQGLNFEVEEYGHFDKLTKFKANMSTREITVPLDIREDAGVASIPEDGWEARPMSVSGRELSLGWIIQNKRFTITKQAKWIDQYSRQAQIESQFKYQGGKAIQALARTVGDYMWGFSTGYLAQCDGGQAGAASHTITLKNGYGLSAITNAGFLARKFVVGDWVALIQGGALVTNAIGQVTARSLSAGTIDVTWNGSVTITDNDYIVLANSLENATVAGTDYNRGAVGFLDMVVSTSLHGLSSATEENWAAAVNNSDGGRFTGVDIHSAAQEIENWGGGALTDMWLAQGVERDMIAAQQAAVRFSSPMGMELDGSVKRKGTTFHSSRRVPPGFVFGYDKKSINKLVLLPSKPSEPMWEDGEKLENRPIWAFGIDLPWNLVCLNRKNLALFTGRTEQ
jgi:hypothetical protein